MDVYNFRFFLILAAIGCSFCDILPSEINGVRNKNVSFIPSLPPGVQQVIIVLWNFNSKTGSSTILNDRGLGPTVAKAYQGRVIYNTTTYALQLNNLQPSDSGTYTLALITDTEPVNGQTMLSVLETVADVQIASNLPEAVEFNSTVVLTCSAKGSLLKYKWMNRSTIIVSDGKRVVVNDSQLIINGVWRTDLQKPIFCVAENDLEGARSALFNLTVSYGPEAVNMTQNPDIPALIKGSNMTLSCSAVSSPDAVFSWYFNGVQLPYTTQTVVLQDLKEENSGNYSCMAFNSKTMRYTASQQSTMIVLEPVSGTYINGPNISLIADNSYCNLTCKSTAGKVDKVNWFKNGKALAITDRISLSMDNRSISIPKVTKQDAGMYTCTVTNRVSTDSSNYMVSISYGPDNVAILGMSKVEVGNPVILNCSVDSVPKPTFLWQFNGTDITDATQDFYKIQNSNENHNGNYTCVTYNSVTGRMISVTHILRVKGVGELNDQLSSGAIAGIIIAVLLALTILICCIVKRRRKIREIPSPY